MLNILSGWETANIKSFPIKSGQKLDQGDWVVFENGELKKQTGAYDGKAACFPVYAGNVSFFDTQYLGRADVVTANSGVLETDKYAADSINAGDPLTIENGALKVATEAGPAVIGFAIEAASNHVVKFALA